MSEEIQVNKVEILDRLVLKSHPMMNVVSVVACLRNAHIRNELKLWRELSGIYPDIPVWAIAKLIVGDYDGDHGKGEIVVVRDKR